MKRQIHQSGYTLIEVIIVIVLVGILIAGSSNILKIGFASFFNGKNINNAYWQASVALERMARDLRVTRRAQDIDLTATTSSVIKITNVDGDSVFYQLNTNKQLLRNNQPIADGVESVNFNYYTYSPTLTEVIPSIITRPSICYLLITLNVKQNDISFPITKAVHLWNLKQ